MIKNTPALHRMKNIIRIFVNHIIQDFKNIAVAVTTQQNMLIGIFVQYIRRSAPFAVIEVLPL
jgi:hypothetical protein